MAEVSDKYSGSAHRHAVILCHPDERSFNAAVAHTYCETVRSLGQQPILRDLYRLGFDPVLKAGERSVTEPLKLSGDVAAELESIRGADVFVLVYPIWFGTPPAMIKGYVERVFGSEFSYRDVHARRPHPLLSGKHLLSITSSGSTATWLDLSGAWMSLRNVFDNYLAKAFSMASSEHLHLESVVEGMTESSGREKLDRVKSFAASICARLPDAARDAATEKAPGRS